MTETAEAPLKAKELVAEEKHAAKSYDMDRAMQAAEELRKELNEREAHCLAWPEFCEREAAKGYAWATTELAIWSLRHGDLAGTMRWLESLSSLRHVPSSAKQRRRQRCTVRFVEVDQERLSLARKATQRSLSLAEAHRLIVDVCVEAQDASAKKQGLYREIDEFVALVKMVTLESWQRSAGKPFVCSVSHIWDASPQAPTQIFWAVGALASKKLLDQTLFAAAISALRHWAARIVHCDQDTRIIVNGLREPVRRRTIRDELMPRILYGNQHWKVLFKPANWAVSWNARLSCSLDTLKYLSTADGGKVVAPFAEDVEPFGAGDRKARPNDLLHWLLRESDSSILPGSIRRDKALSYGIAHRLDAQTSGPILVANTYWGWAWLQLQFRAQRVHKRYVCLCYGQVEGKEIISDGMAKVPISGRGVGFRAVLQDTASPAVTEISAVAHLRGPRYSKRKKIDSEAFEYQEDTTEGDESVTDDIYSLVDIRLWTGRFHQIRAHLSSRGNALVSDPLYGGGLASWCPRVFLHCYLLGVDNDDSRHVAVTSQLPTDLRQALSLAKATDRPSDLLVKKFLGSPSQKPK